MLVCVAWDAQTIGAYGARLEELAARAFVDLVEIVMSCDAIGPTRSSGREARARARRGAETVGDRVTEEDRSRSIARSDRPRRPGLRAHCRATECDREDEDHATSMRRSSATDVAGVAGTLGRPESMRRLDCREGLSHRRSGAPGRRTTIAFFESSGAAFARSLERKEGCFVRD